MNLSSSYPVLISIRTRHFFYRLENGISKYNNSKIDDGLYRPISISFGYAVVNQGESLEEGYKKADQAMYANKMR